MMTTTCQDGASVSVHVPCLALSKRCLPWRGCLLDFCSVRMCALH